MNLKPKIYLLGFLPILAVVMASLGASCEQGNNSDSYGKKAIARAYSKTLYLEDMKGLFIEASNNEDSIVIINQFAENWIKDQLLLREAERNLPENSSVEKLVENYRHSLILNQYERFLVEIEMDSTVTQDIAEDYFQQRSRDFILTEDIFKVLLVKIDLNQEEYTAFQKLWADLSQSSLAGLSTWCTERNIEIEEDSTRWLTRNDIKQYFDQEDLIIKLNNRQSFKEESLMTYVWLYDERKKGANSPFSYAKDQVDRVILFRRQKQILKDKRASLYENEAKRNNIEIFTP